MGIYIPDVKLSQDDKYKFGLTLVISYDGTVRSPWGNLITDAKAVELPPHGDLIDRSKIVYSQDGCGFRTMEYACRAQLDNMIPVIPADLEKG